MRVLFVGHCNDTYIGYLNQVLKSNFTDVVTGVVDLFSFGAEINTNRQKYDYQFSSRYTPDKLATKRKKLGFIWSQLNTIELVFLAKCLFRFNFIKIFLKAIEIYNSTDRKIFLKYIVDEFKPTHLHVHYLNEANLKWLESIEDECKIILSFWGSDLMTTARGIEEYRLQYNALRRANVITTQTLDLRTILLSKYGQELISKVVCQTFNPLLGKRDLLKGLIYGNNTHGIKSKYNVPKDNICIQVGYSANKSQNHLEVLNALNNINKKIRDKICVFIPLTYNGEEDYINTILTEIKKLEYKVIPITSFLSDKEMMEVVSVCDILISVRNNDALNAAIVESLYIQNIVITGSWLPYGIYQRAGINFETVDSICEVPHKVEKLVKNWGTSKRNVLNNQGLLDQLYNDDALNERWRTIYE